MKRILLEIAELRDGLYWFEDKLFTGVGFERGERRTVIPHLIEGGRIVGPYRSLCEEGQNVTLRIDLEGASGDYDPILYEGEPFFEMGYEFSDKGFCYYEVHLASESSIRWKPNGDMVKCHLYNGEIFEVSAWDYDDGRWKSWEASDNGEIFLRFWGTNGELDYLSSKGGMVGRLDRVAAATKFAPIRRKSDLCKMMAGDHMHLFGTDIDLAFVHFLVDGGVLRNVENLEFRRTQITEMDDKVLEGMPKLRELNIEAKTEDGLAVAQAAKALRPNLIVRFNETVL